MSLNKEQLAQQEAWLYGDAATKQFHDADKIAAETAFINDVPNSYWRTAAVDARAADIQARLEARDNGFEHSHGVFIQPEVEAQKAQAKADLTEAQERGDVKRIVDVDTVSIQTMLQAVDFFGDEVSKNYGINEDKVVTSHHQLDAVMRQKAIGNDEVINEIAAMSEEDAAALEDVGGSRPDLEPNVVTAEEREANRVQSLWQDLQAEGDLLRSDVVDDATFVVTALSLQHMRTHADSRVERGAADVALETLRKKVEAQVGEVKIVQPEVLERAEETGELGAWAGATVVRAIDDLKLLAPAA